MPSICRSRSKSGSASPCFQWNSHQRSSTSRSLRPSSSPCSTAHGNSSMVPRRRNWWINSSPRRRSRSAASERPCCSTRSLTMEGQAPSNAAISALIRPLVESHVGSAPPRTNAATTSPWPRPQAATSGGQSSVKNEACASRISRDDQTLASTSAPAASRISTKLTSPRQAARNRGSSHGPANSSERSRQASPKPLGSAPRDSRRRTSSRSPSSMASFRRMGWGVAMGFLRNQRTHANTDRC